MAKCILVVGGSRSGKSSYAQSRAERGNAPRYYLATCPPTPDDLDAEMAARIRAHQRQRVEGQWQTIEEPLELIGLLPTLPAQATVLIDCLTLWISNLLFADTTGTLDEARMANMSQELLSCCQSRTGELYIVSSEVGCGIVPEHALARRFRDLVGRCNQVIAAGADQVVHVVCGIPTIIKG